MAKNTVSQLMPIFQELDLQLQKLESIVFQAYITSGHVRETWRELVMASKVER